MPERPDGLGYPGGLTEEDILLKAKTLALADMVEAVISHRPHRAAMILEEMLVEIS